jgi:septum formation protein
MVSTKPPLLLASTSPRRAELLTRLGIPFEIVPTEVPEAAFFARYSPSSVAIANACAKALSIAAEPGQLVLGADTVVVLGEDCLGKPQDVSEAADMLRRLSGQTHSVITGLCLLRHGTQPPAEQRTDAVATRVTMAELDEATIRAYVATGEPFDKAGAYGIQERGAVLVERIDGDYFNVVGLPLCRLSQLLRELGVTISDYWS